VAGRWNPGDAVVLREVWHGRLFGVRPVTVIRDDPGDRRLLVWPGQVALAARTRGGRWLRTPTDEPWTLEPQAWRGGWIVSFSRPGKPHAVLAFCDRRSWRLTGWYVNLESPLRPVPDGFEWEDRILDATVAADRSSWRWKDEDDLADATAAGRVDPHDAERWRREGGDLVDRILRGDPPFDEDPRSWKPGRSWRRPPDPDLAAYG
jgi:hypothetical protein